MRITGWNGLPAEGVQIQLGAPMDALADEIVRGRSRRRPHGNPFSVETGGRAQTQLARFLEASKVERSELAADMRETSSARDLDLERQWVGGGPRVGSRKTSGARPVQAPSSWRPE